MVISILVSISFAPILLSISPTPAFQRTNPMTLRQLYVSSPLGCVGMFLLGGVFSSQFGMAAVFGAAADLRLGQISAFVAAFYVGAMVLQYPIGWFSDRMDRRVLISIVSAMGALAALVGIFGWFSFPVLLGAAFLIGGMSNPLYSLLIAHTNDFLDYEDMVAASSGLLFINGLGAISGPLIVGWVMDRFGPSGFFLVIGTLMGGLTIYALYRMTQRASVAVEDTGVYAAVAPSASPVALKIAQDYAVDIAGEEEEG